MKEDEKLIRAVITTLDNIPVQGRENMKKIMACITILEKLLGLHEDLKINYTGEPVKEQTEEQADESPAL